MAAIHLLNFPLQILSPLHKPMEFRGGRASSIGDSEELIKKAFCDNKPFVMEFDISNEENVFPIVPPGSNNTEALFKK